LVQLHASQSQELLLSSDLKTLRDGAEPSAAAQTANFQTVFVFVLTPSLPRRILLSQ
jgi:hypothetical protein